MNLRFPGLCALAFLLVQPAFAGTLLRTNFETADWTTRSVATSTGTVTASGAYGAYGTIDTQTDVPNNGVDVPSKGLLFTVNSSAATGAWKASLTSGVLALTTANTTVTNLGLLTLSFSLRASRANPVVVRLESYDATGTTRTGGLSTLIYPATADYYQRFALDLSTMRPDGAGTFSPTATKIAVTFELDSTAGGDGWPAASGLTLKVDNVHYATPAYYVAATGGVDAAGKGTLTAPFATANYAMGLVVPGDIIVLRGGTYNSSISFRKYVNNAYVAVAGAPDAWVALKNYPGEKPVVRNKTWGIINLGLGTSTVPYTGPSSAYLEIRGLNVLGYSQVDAYGDRSLDPTVATPSLEAKLGNLMGETNCGGIYAEGRNQTNLMHDLRFADNIVEYTSSAGFGWSRVDRVLCENNISRFTSWWSVYGTSGISTLVPVDFENNNDYRCVVQNNQCYGNETMAPCSASDTKFSDGNGIIIDVNRNVEAGFPTAGLAYRGKTLVQNNLVYNNGGSGIHAFNAQNVDILHNTAYLNSASAKLVYGQIFAGYAKNVHIVDNILVAPANITGDTTFNEAVTSNGTQNVVGTIFYQNNLLYGLGSAGTNPTYPASQAAPSPSANFLPNNTANPGFLAPSINPANANFRLRSASPARNAAPAYPYNTARDLTLRPRPLTTTSDLGAFQTQATLAYGPALSPAPGNYSGSQTVTMTSDTSGAKIVYTTSATSPASTPTVDATGNITNGTLYTAPIPIPAKTSVNAIAWVSGLGASDVSGGDYTFNDFSAVPIPNLIFLPDAGTYAGTTLVGLMCRTPGAIIRYTTDGSTPSPTNGTIAPAPMPAMTRYTTLKAIAYLPGRANSAVKTAVYTITGTLGTPTAGSTLESLGANTIRFVKFTATSANTLSNVYARVSGAGKYSVALYSDNAGVPNSRLANSSVLTNPAAGWNTFTFPTPYAVASGTVYWLAIWSDSATAQIYADTTGGTGRQPTTAPATYGSWPTSAGSTSPSADAAFAFALYAAPANLPPTVSVPNANLAVTLPSSVGLSVTVTDDGLPKIPGVTATVAWSKVSGPTPGNVTFGNATALATNATFSDPGTYVLRVTASDGSLSASANVTVTVSAAPAGNATYLGTLNAGTTTVPVPASGARFARFQAGGTFTVVNLFARTVAAGTGSVYRAALYGESNGQPGALLSRSTTRLFEAPTGWNKFVLETPQPITSGTFYWLAIWSNSANGAIYADPTGGSVSQFNGNTLGGNGTWPNPAVATTLTSAPNATLSLYAAPDATNLAPVLSIGGGQTVNLPDMAVLAGSVTDDNLPLAPGAVACRWSVVSGPGAVFFADPAAPTTTAGFSLPGTYVLQIDATDGEASATPVQTTVLALDCYPAWAARNGVVGTGEGDADGDGASDLLEYALDTNPRSAGSTPRPDAFVDPNGLLSLGFIRSHGELLYTVEASDDLVTWEPLVTNPGNVGDYVVVPYNPPVPGPTAFLRLRVERP